MCASEPCIYFKGWKGRYDRLVWDPDRQNVIASARENEYRIKADLDDVAISGTCMVCPSCFNSAEVRLQQLFLLLQESNTL